MGGVGVFVVLCCVGVVGTFAASAPFIEPCLEGDKQCMLRSAAKTVPILAAGIPSLGIKPLDPMQLGRVKTNNAGLKMDFRNTEITGLKNSEVMKLVRHGEHLELRLKCSLEMAGNYTIAGRLLVMPIEGDGRYHISIRDMVVQVLIEFGERQQGGDTFWTIDNWKQNSRVETGARFRFENLFNGNKKLSDGVHQFANSNWREIFQEVAPPIVEKTVGQIVAEVGKLFYNVPIRELTRN